MAGSKPFGNLQPDARPNTNAVPAKKTQGAVPKTDKPGVDGTPVNSIPDHDPAIPWPPATVQREERGQTVETSQKKPFKI